MKRHRIIKKYSRKCDSTELEKKARQNTWEVEDYVCPSLALFGALSPKCFTELAENTVVLWLVSLLLLQYRRDWLLLQNCSEIANQVIRRKKVIVTYYKKNRYLF